MNIDVKEGHIAVSILDSYDNYKERRFTQDELTNLVYRVSRIRALSKDWDLTWALGRGLDAEETMKKIVFEIRRAFQMNVPEEDGWQGSDEIKRGRK